MSNELPSVYLQSLFISNIPKSKYALSHPVGAACRVASPHYYCLLGCFFHRFSFALFLCLCVLCVRATENRKCSLLNLMLKLKLELWWSHFCLNPPRTPFYTSPVSFSYSLVQVSLAQLHQNLFVLCIYLAPSNPLCDSSFIWQSDAITGTFYSVLRY